MGNADHLEALLVAAADGDAAGVAAAIAAEPELVRRSIHAAAAVADADAAAALLAAEPFRATEGGGRDGWTPLYRACASRHREGDPTTEQARARLVADLLAHGADPDDEVPALDVPGGFRSALQAAAGRGRAELAEVLLAAGASLLPTFGTAGPPIPLTEAVVGGSVACLERLLAARPDTWQTREALEIAVFHDRADMTERLLRYGAEPSFAGRWWGNGGSCLHAAILLERPRRLLELLLTTDVDVARRDRDGRTAYAIAARIGHDVAAELLRARGASEGELDDVDRLLAACFRLDAAEVRRRVGTPPKATLRPGDHAMLSWAIRHHRSAAVPLLLEAGLDPRVVDGEGDTPLHHAAAAGEQEAVGALLAAGASAAAENYRGATPFAPPVSAAERRVRDELFERAADAVASGDLEALRALLDASPDLVCWRSPRAHHATLLLYCGANGTEALRQRTPPTAPAIAQLLLERGADPNAAGNFYGGGAGATTLAMVLTSASPIEAGVDAELVRVLVRGGARLDLWTDGAPIRWALERGRAETARVLAEAGAPPT